MNFLSNALQNAMDERGWKQGDVVERSGLSQSQISRYLSGVQPDRENVRKLLACFDADREHWEFLSAWLKDQIPDDFRHSIMVVPHHGSPQESEPQILEERIGRLPHRTRKAVERLIAATERRPEAMTRAIESMLELTEPPRGRGS